MRLNGNSTIVRFTPDHYPTLRAWYAARGKPVPSIEALSDVGYVADGRVMGFLYLTNSNVAMIEGIIADPNTVPSLRQESLTKLAGFLVDYALMLGYNNIFALTKHPSVLKTAKRLGFKTDTSFQLLTLSEHPSEQD